MNNNILEEKLVSYAKNNLNVMLIGGHGVGKTSMVIDISKQINLKLKYYSSSTLDPFVDLVGVPVPILEKETIKFLKPEDLMDAEWIFFDELNRAHERVLNAVLEIIQFGTVNGIKLPKLKMVWAAINPPGENYQVNELDSPLVDRFHCYVKVPSELNLSYLCTKMNPDVAMVLKTWWDTHLNDEQRKVFTPRRVEYVGTIISKNLPWRDSVPQGHVFPLDQLSMKLNKFKNNVTQDDELEISVENILNKPEYFTEKAKSNPRLYTLISEIVRKFDKDDIFKTKDLLESFPADLLNDTLLRKFPGFRRESKEDFINNKIDISKYPKLSKALRWDEIEN